MLEILDILRFKCFIDSGNVIFEMAYYSENSQNC
jgi:hypothetical protein